MVISPVLKERLVHYAQYAGITLVIVLVLFLGRGIYYKLFPKPTTTTIGDVQSGGIVNITNKNGRSRFIVPFVEGGAEARDKEKIGAFIRAGLRIEF